MAELISPQEAEQLVLQGKAVLIDVRESEEYGAQRIALARLQPLSVLRHLPQDDDRDKAAIYFCNSGRRTSAAVQRLEERGHAKTYILENGLEGWKKAGLAVETSPGPWPLTRQVHAVAGALIIIFLLLGQKMPLFRLFAVFIGFGLLTSGLTGACGMALLLKKMPWNKNAF